MQFRVTSQVVGGLYPGEWGVEAEIKKNNNINSNNSNDDNINNTIKTNTYTQTNKNNKKATRNFETS